MNEKTKNGNLKRFLLIFGGTLLGLVFLYLAFRDVSWAEFVGGLRTMKPIYLLPAIVLMCTVQFIRSLRFRIIISPFCKLSVKDSWDLMNIWAGASIILPARLGELVRPYLLQQRKAPFSSGFGAVMVERFFDLSGLLLLLGVVLWRTPEVPKMYSSLGLVMLIALALGYVIVLLMLKNRPVAERWFSKIVSFLPEKATLFLESIFKKLLDGLGIMASLKQAAIIFAYSVSLWVTFSALTYLFLLAFSIDAPFLAAVTIQVFICFGVALAPAPGFIGTFHAAGRYALTLFNIEGVTAATAVSFATVYHLFSVSMCLALGLLSYLTGRFTFDYKLFQRPHTEENEGDINFRSESVASQATK
jgi:glycosyltransferase 2 family protein